MREKDEAAAPAIRVQYETVFALSPPFSAVHPRHCFKNGEAEMAVRTVADIEEQIKKLKDQIRKRRQREAKRLGKIPERAGLTERDISDAQLLSEFSAIAARCPEKS